ncbi:hypothetical protein Dsin_001774 [Dipteronia sinensis]|uniref:Uncharacterized protein n=1 Tax=Dipteronia sinensis TaxID=43782 RepID=A0AAE0B5E8_9ROSI|nr:hypothetical protein Dsin_001774 [Dipteronia sinensis]
MWVDHPDFMNLVHRVWSIPCDGRPPQIVIGKLKNLKRLSSLGIGRFSLISMLTSLRNLLCFGPFRAKCLIWVFVRSFFFTESHIHHDLDVLFRRHECFLRDRSRVKWLQDRDHNSSFFHSSIKRRQCRSVLSSLSIDGVISVDQTVIRDHIVRFYVDLFSSDSDLNDQDLPSNDVIHDAVFAMDALAAPRPDGFSGRFCQRCWEIVGRDVILEVQDFFHSGVVKLGLNFNFIVLLPKMTDSITIDQFRPFVFSNILFKVSYKILADRLA